MLIHHIRNATLLLSTGDKRIIVDPIFSPAGALPPFRWITPHRRRNPVVDLPPEAEELILRITHALITHCRKGHVDHLDRPAIEFLKEREIPVYCSEDDADYLKKRNLKVRSLRRKIENPFLNDGVIKPVPCRHGRGWISHFMSNGVGYYIRLPGEPTLYITGDTVLTEEVRKTIIEYQPDWLVLAAGGARLDFGNSLLMSEEELYKSIKLSEGRVILNHLEALDHCPVTRSELLRFYTKKSLQQRVIIPEDGERIDCVPQPRPGN